MIFASFQTFNVKVQNWGCVMYSLVLNLKSCVTTKRQTEGNNALLEHALHVKNCTFELNASDGCHKHFEFLPLTKPQSILAQEIILEP